MRRVHRPVRRALHEAGLYIVANRGKIIRFSRVDRAIVEAHTWTAVQVKPGRWYACTYIRGEGGRQCWYLHQLILGHGVDHINGDGLDCRRENLRHATPSQQQANQRKRRQEKLTSRYKGVSWCNGRWQVLCGPHSSQRYVGRFDDEEQAAAAYDRRAVEVFGEFARLNFP